jgi:hypothetical protein
MSAPGAELTSTAARMLTTEFQDKLVGFGFTVTPGDTAFVVGR